MTTHSKYLYRHPDGSRAGYINTKLVAKQNISDERLSLIISLHEQKLAIFAALSSGVTKPDKTVAALLTNIEFQLQDAWGFPRDSNYHRFWECPSCLCPKIDNEENYPVGHYWFNAACPLHGVVK